MSIVMRSGFVFALLLGILAAESAHAQYGVPSIPGRKSKAAAADSQIPAALRTPFKGTGTVEAVAPGGMQVSASGAQWLVKFDRNCKVDVTGTADPAFLKPGLIVRFSAEFDKKGKALAPLNELEIVSPQTAMVEAKARRAAAAGIETKPEGDGDATMPSGLIGRITAVKNGTLTLETGEGVVRADLGANPAIKVNSSDYSLAQKGDKVDVRGWYVQAPEAMAEDVKITLANPLGSTVKKTPVKPAEKPAEKTAAK